MKLIQAICYFIVMYMPLCLSRKLMYTKPYMWMIGQAGCWAFRDMHFETIND